MKRSDSEWSYSIKFKKGTNSAFHSRFINQYTFFQKFELMVTGQEAFNAMELFSQISPYNDNQISAQAQHCISEIVAHMLISGSCIYYFDKKKTNWKFAIPEELGGEETFAKNVILLDDFLENKAKLFLQFSQEDKKNRHSNLKKVYDEHLIAAAKAFRSWGFYLTDASDVTGYYLAYAHLKTERAKAILRDYVLSTIEKNLIYMGYDIKFEMKKIRSMRDFEEEIKKMEKGLLSPTDAFKIKEAYA